MIDPNCSDAHLLLAPSRRRFLATAGAFAAWASLPRHAYAAGRDPRFLTIILRGALDGLAAVPPVGDPDYVALRGGMAIGAAGMEAVLPLDGMFGLNDAMPGLHGMYGAGEALIVHAAASAYRGRSHFDGQDVLETGMGGVKASATGWMNRLAEAIPQGERVRPVSGLAAMPTVPLIMRGAAPTLTWTPPELRPASADTLQRLAALYGDTDAELARVLAAGVDTDRLAGAAMTAQRSAGTAAAFREIAVGSARLLVAEDGPRLAVLSYDGWDTHTDEGAEDGRLADLLAALDGSLQALKETLAPVWADTVIAVVTEFGRTARGNGTDGTDHGTATTAFLLGGAVKGGRVLADWPGLKPGQLFEARDLMPTTDLRGVLKGVLRDHLGVSERVLNATVFPDSIGIRPIDGLVG